MGRMSISELMRVFWKWLLLIVLAAVVAGISAYVVMSKKTPMYMAKSELLIGDFGAVTNSNPLTAQNLGLLAQFYVELVKTDAVLQQTIDALDLPLTVEELRRIVTIRNIGGTYVLTLSVAYPDPERAVDIVNQVISQIISSSAIEPSEQEQNRIEFFNEQIDLLTGVVEDAREQLKAIDIRLEDAQDQELMDELNVRRDTLIVQINQASTAIVQMYSELNALQVRENIIKVIEQPQIPTTPVGIRPRIAAILGSGVGFFLAAGAVILIEYFNTAIKISDDIHQSLGIPVLGTIPRFGRRRAAYNRSLIVHSEPFSAASDAYRALQTRLLPEGKSEQVNIFVITSPNAQEGKSVTAANMAISTASSGLRTLLIDADLRQPTIHKIFGFEKSTGLSEFLLSDAAESLGHQVITDQDRNMRAKDIADLANVSVSSVYRVLDGKNNVSEEVRQKVAQAIEKVGTQSQASSEPTDVPILNDYEQYLHATPINNLYVMMSGSTSLNPIVLLTAHLNRDIFQNLAQAANFDIIIFDTPPCLLVADSHTVVTKMKPTVVLVVETNRTRREAALKAKQSLEEIGTSPKGIVLNKTKIINNKYYRRYSND